MKSVAQNYHLLLTHAITHLTPVQYYYMLYCQATFSYSFIYTTISFKNLGKYILNTSYCPYDLCNITVFNLFQYMWFCDTPSPLHLLSLHILSHYVPTIPAHSILHPPPLPLPYTHTLSSTPVILPGDKRCHNEPCSFSPKILIRPKCAT